MIRQGNVGNRWKLRKIVLLITLIVVVFPAQLMAEAAPTGDAQIKGAAKFLTARANDNYLYVVEKRILDNEIFKEYFPNTYKLIVSLDLMRALQVKQNIWQAAINKDLEDLVTRYLDSFFLKGHGKQHPLKAKLQALSALKAPIPGLMEDKKNEPLIKQEAESAKKAFQDIEKNLAILITIEQLRNLITQKKPLGKDDIQNAQNAIDNWTKLEDTSAGLIENNMKNIVSQIAAVSSLLDDVKGDLKALSEDLRIIQDKSSPYVLKVSSSISIIQYIDGKAEKNIYRDEKQAEKIAKYLDQCRDFALSIAQLADAENEEQVQAVLKSITMPSVSFGVKRKQGEGHFLLSSYFGVAAGAESTSGSMTEEKEYTFAYGLHAPVGFEWSLGCGRRSPGVDRDGYSLGLFASIVDLGPAVNAQLAQKEAKFDFKDIVAPGLFFVYGFKDLPLAMGIGYQRSMGMNTPGIPEHHALLFLSFDMPLWIFY